ncbi:MAG: type II secretion system protein [Patescibacteria group bacterium]
MAGFQNKKNFPGFTLIEVLIYAAIFAVVSVLVLDVIFLMAKTTKQLKAGRDINSAAASIIERMTREIKLADGIDVSESSFDASPGKLVLNSIDFKTEESATIAFYLAGTNLMMQKDSLAAEALNSPKVKVSSLVFREVENSVQSKAVKIELEIKALSKTEKFYNSAILRRSY